MKKVQVAVYDRLQVSLECRCFHLQLLSQKRNRVQTFLESTAIPLGEFGTGY